MYLWIVNLLLFRNGLVKNNLGPLVTEVGFFVFNRQYFVKPGSTDKNPIDEYSIFASRPPMDPQFYRALKQMFGMVGENVDSLLMHSQWIDVLVSNAGMFSLMYDPFFIRDIIVESKEYTLNGIDLNPYLNRNSMENKYKDINLPRVLSYEIDSMAGLLLNPQAFLQPIHQSALQLGLLQFGLFGLRTTVIGNYIGTLSSQLNESDTKQLNSYYMAQVRIDSTALAQINEWAQADDVDSLSASQVPFLLDVYEEYKESKKSKPALFFITFVREHPLVCAEPGVSQIILPYNSTNMMSKTCENFNVYRKCIGEHNDTPCENINDKKIHNMFFSPSR